MTLPSWCNTRGPRARTYSYSENSNPRVLFLPSITLLLFTSLTVQAQTLLVNTPLPDAEVLSLSSLTLFLCCNSHGLEVMCHSPLSPPRPGAFFCFFFWQQMPLDISGNFSSPIVDLAHCWWYKKKWSCIIYFSKFRTIHFLWMGSSFWNW